MVSFYALLFFACVNIVSAENEQIVKQWSTAAETFDRFLWPQAPKIVELISNVTNGSRFEIGDQCANSLSLLATGIQSRKLWALKFIEASALTKNNFLQGYMSDFGDFEECIHIKADSIIGQYCVLSLNFPLPPKPLLSSRKAISLDLKGTDLEGTYYQLYATDVRPLYNEAINFGFCVPSNCTQSEIKNVIYEYFRETNLNANLKGCSSLEIQNASFEEHPFHRNYFMIAMILFILVATYLAEIVKQGLLADILKSFSVIRNTEKLWPTSQNGERELGFVHGLRFYFHVWTILGHLIGMYAFLPSYFAMFRKVEYSHWLIEEVIDSILVGIAMFFFLRTTPALVGVILLQHVFALNSKNTNPIAWDILNKLENNCVKNWWLNLLYLNNWLHPLDQCILNTWSLSVDWQLYIMSFLIIKWLYFSPKKGVISLLTLMVIGTLLTMFQTYYYDLPPFVELFTPSPNFFDNIHYTFFTFNYISSYFLGILVAYLVINDIKPKNK
ncbi:Nose resistant to fluoxetine protein 6-like protein, partial [Dinothrombium tinctorium]